MSKSQPVLNWKDQRVNRDKIPGYVPLGPRPSAPSEAWWKLSHEAKTMLQTERMAGRFGGVPGTAPYWHVQEVGEERADVEPQFYIRQIVDLWKPLIGRALAQFLSEV